MLPLLFTFLATLYLYAPGLLFRWAVGLAVGRENLKQPPSKVEETTQALVWIAIPLAITIAWVVLTHALHGQGAVFDFERVFASLYSEATFRNAPTGFFVSFWAVCKENLRLLWRLYLIVGTYSAVTYFALRNARRLTANAFGRRLLRFALVTSPPLAEWFILLSGMYLPPNLEIHADVLMRSGTLYQGRVSDYSLEVSGALRSLTLEVPRRFLREDFKEKQSKWPQAKPGSFWHDVPGNLFVIFCGDVSNINFRYVLREDAAQEGMAVLPANALSELLTRLDAR